VAGTPGAQADVVVEPAPQVVAFADFGVDPTSVTVGPLDEHSLHGQWSPVDVPPPTYTLKAKATHPLPDRHSESEVHAQSGGEPMTAGATLGVVDVDDDDVPARWVVGG